MMRWLLLILMLAPAAGFSQQPARKSAAKKAAPPAAVPNKWPIVKLVVEGNQHYTAQQILAVAGVKVGELAGQAEFDAARDRLVASGFFENISYRFDPAPNGQQGDVGTFQVVESSPSYPVRFEALPASADELDRALAARDPLFSKTNLPATQPVLDRYVRWLQEYLATKGSSEKLTARLSPTNSGEFGIVFRPARNLPMVAQVTFEGNHAVSQDDLRDAIAPVAVGTPYTEDNFRELLNAAVRTVYEAHGYVRVKFPKLRTEPAPGVQGLHVFVTVEEGESYQLRKVAIPGPTPVRPQDLIKAADIPAGQTANFDRVRDGLEKMRKALLHAGYMQAQVTSQRMIDDAAKAIDLAVTVTPGPQYAMGKLTVVGLDLDGEAEIRRIWATKEGKPFNADYPQLFLDRVREQGIFDNLGTTKQETNVDDVKHVVDVTLTFNGNQQAKPGRGGRFGERP